MTTANNPFAIVPVAAVAVDISSADFDLTTAFAMGYARRIYVGTGGTVIVKWLGDSVAKTYKNMASGSYMDGTFSAVVKAGTLAADMIAEA